MTKLEITHHGRAVSFVEALNEVIDYEAQMVSIGTIERLKAQLEQQTAIMARMLMVQFGQYEDHFTSPEYEPKTDADKLAFIIGGYKVRVNEV